jgi:hypothetical protein
VTAPPSTRPAVGAAPPDPWEAWTAEIEWREMGVAAFFAVVARPAGPGSAVTIAASPPLAWPPADSTSVRALQRAVDELESGLTSAGWSPAPAGDAWYARRFAWEPAAVPQAVAEIAPAPERGLFTAGPEWPQGSADRWRCEIAWQAGWADSRFEALVYAPAAPRGRTIARSHRLRWLLMAQPDAAAAEHRRALGSLAAALAAAGWEPVGRGADWYARRFCWARAGAPPDRLRMRNEHADVGNRGARAY